MDGPGRCTGRVEISYRGKWQKVAEGAEDNFTNTVCKLLKCGKTGKKETQGFSQGSSPFLPMALSCGEGVTRISQCIKDEKANAPGGKALALTCKSECVSHWSLLPLNPPPQNVSVRSVIYLPIFTGTTAGRKHVRKTFQCVIFQNIS